ncbi:MAG TPA: hypothetical protein VFY28_00070 [Candidatus Paceibacterota bacterium]|nr:hypothetical protein [Candidatus Paceibacterota bacterium]
MSQFSATRVYDLRFVAEGEKGFPELVVSIHAPFTTLAEEHINRLRGNEFHETGVPFHRGDEAFGFGRCAYLIRSEGQIEYRFLLMRGTAPNLARTLDLVLGVANALVAKSETDNRASGRQPNREQVLTVLCGYVSARDLHRYPINGWVSPSFRRWLSQLAARSEEKPCPLMLTKPMPEPVRFAMQQAWEAIAKGELLQLGSDASARIAEDGRFILACFGNACDVAIYPELDFGSEEGFNTMFDCHNLDMAEQQVTLLTGLAVLHELAVADLG